MIEKEHNYEQYLVPLATLGLLAIATMGAFTRKQREALLERDDHQCQAPVKHECNETEHPLEIDHLLPQRYLGLFGVDPDQPENALTKCRNAHDIKHPDRIKARKEYHQEKKKGKNSFLSLFAERKKKLENRQIYWNDENDRADQVVAMKRTQEAESKGWVFPPKKKKP